MTNVLYKTSAPVPSSDDNINAQTWLDVPTLTWQYRSPTGVVSPIATGGSLTSLTGTVNLGTQPPAGGAINVDISTAGYNGIALQLSSGLTLVGSIQGDSTHLYVIAASGQQLQLFANGLSKWTINANGAGTSELQATQATARILGGSTSLSLRNSADSADNLLMTDAGNLTLRCASGTLLATSTTLTNNAAAAAGTLTNAPVAGNPTKWIPINDNGTTRNIPAW